MLYSLWLHWRKTYSQRSGGRRGRPTRRTKPFGRTLFVESLEDRKLLSVFTVTNTGDNSGVNPLPGAGTGTLRQAIVDANAAATGTAANPDLIQFAIPTSDLGYNPTTGAFTIAPLSHLPDITDTSIVDGYSQPGASPNTLLGPAVLGSTDPVLHPGNYGDNAVLKIVLNGANPASGTGLALDGNNITVQGLVINQFNQGIGVGGSGDIIQGNFLGTDVTGMQALGNAGADIYLQSASQTTIGGSTPAARNIISAALNNPGNSGGYGIIPSSGGHTVIQGNFIGTDVTGRNSLGNATAGIGFDGGGALVVGNVISGNNGYGIDGEGPQVFQSNFIGTDVTGTKALGNGMNGPGSGIGIFMYGGGGGQTYGGPGAGNLISGNYNGIEFTGDSNVFQGNFIGTDVTGTQNLGNSNGLWAYGVGNNNVIGGTAAGDRNIISGNSNGMYLIAGQPSSGNVVEGNYIGTNITGTVALGNNIGIGLGSSWMIGGTTAAPRNVISGNSLGVYITDGASNNLVQGNYIGTDWTGTRAVGNNYGIYVVASSSATVSNNTIGGTLPGLGDVISGNSAGIALIGGVTNNFVQGNLIGTDTTGTVALSNGNGILIEGANNNTIGGTASGAGNTIAFSGGGGSDGLGVYEDSGTGNSILGNSIFSNNAGIVLNSNNNANDNQAAPVLTSAIATSTGTTISGTLQSVASTTFRVEFFSNTSPDPSGYGQGQTYLGFVTVMTDANGKVVSSPGGSATIANGVFTPALGQLSPLPAGQTVLSATATNLATGDTSQFSQDLILPQSPSATEAVVVSVAASDQITLTGGSNPGQVSVTIGGGQPTAIGAGQVYVSGQGGSDTYTVNFGSTLTTPITIAGSGTDTLTVNGSTSSNTISVSSTQVSWRSPVTETVSYSGVNNVLVNDGTGGNDAITVNSNASSVTIAGQGGTDSYVVYVGSLAGPVAIVDNGPATVDSLSVYGISGQNTSSNWNKTADTIIWSNPNSPSTLAETISFTNANVTIYGDSSNNLFTDPNSQNTTLVGGPGTNTFVISNTTGNGVVAEGGSGSNNFIINMGNLQGPVTINSTTGTNTVTVNGPPGTNVLTLTAAHLTGAGESINFSLGSTAANLSVVGGIGNNNQLVIQGIPAPLSVQNVVLPPGVSRLGAQVFIVGGSTTNDQVQIRPVGSSTTGSTGVQVMATLNGVATTMTFTQSVTDLEILGYRGNDTIQLAVSLTVSATISAGNGNDTVQAGSGPITVTLGNGNDTVQLGNGNNTVTLGNGNDTVHLGNGNNVVVTGNGNNTIQAGNGDNLIAAGLGQHTVQVGNGSNILIDGTVTLTQSGDSLCQVLADWISYGKAASNVASIRKRLQITYNTNHANTLMAGSGLDWFFATYAGDTINRKPTDLLN